MAFNLSNPCCSEAALICLPVLICSASHIHIVKTVGDVV